MLENYGPPASLTRLEYPDRHPITLARRVLADSEPAGRADQEVRDD
jgi:hypothetical protein